MLSQEQKRLGCTGDAWLELPAADGTMYYVSVFGRLTDRKPKISRGGFLCDEMGLGKTVCCSGFACGLLLTIRVYSHQGYSTTRLVQCAGSLYCVFGRLPRRR